MTYPNESARTTGTTAGGMNYTVLTVYPYGGTDKALVFLPETQTDGAGSTVMIAAHGSGGNEGYPNLARMVPIRDGALERGWIVASAFAHDRAWANNNALTDYELLHDWVNDQWPVEHTLLQGESMGGLTVAVLAAQNRFPTLRGTAIVDAAVNLRAAYDAAYGGQISAAYGVAVDGSDYAALTAGHDAVLRAPENYSGKRFFVSASPADTQIVKANHSDVFLANFSDEFGSLVVRTGTGTHVTAENFFPEDELAFFEEAITPSSWPPFPPGPPATPTHKKLWTGAVWDNAPIRSRFAGAWA